MNKWIRNLIAGAGVGAIGVALLITQIGFAFEKNFGLPWLFQIRGPVEAPPEVAVVAIDNTTGKALDLPKLPRDWSRTVHAQLIEQLVQRGAAVIVFDFDFSRPKSEPEDQTFAEAIAEANRVILYQALSGRKQLLYDAEGRPSGSIWIEEGVLPSPPLARAAKAIAPFPLPKLEQAAFQFWTFKSSSRDAPTTAAVALQLYALDVYDTWLVVLESAAPKAAESVPRGVDHLRTVADIQSLMQAHYSLFKADPELRGKILAAVRETSDLDDREMQLVLALANLYGGPENRFINFYGPPGSVTTVPFQALIRPAETAGVTQSADLANKVVFVGYSDLFDPDQPDRFYTVFTGDDGVDLSGVEIMATAFANLLTNRTMRAADPALALVLVLLFGIVVGCITYLLPAVVGVPIAVALTALYGTGAQIVFNVASMWFPLATPILVQLPLALLIGLMGQYLLERRKEREISRAISYYLPEDIVKDLTEKRIDPGTVNRVIYGTCLATDMSGFTTISETKSPDQLATFMNAYFDALAQPLKRHSVTVTEFHADTIMCAWTTENPTIAVRRNAILAAIDTVAAIRQFSEQYSGIELRPRIGLQDGHFYLGHTGGGGRFTYSILGDPANTAARLEALNKHLGTHILAAASVTQDIDDLVMRPLGSFRLVGKADATPIVEILGILDGAESKQSELSFRFSDALALFTAQQWAKAEATFHAILERYPDDGPTSLYLATCRRYARDGVPDDKPTVIRMAEK
jgi:adenylate cyclase